MIRDRTSACRLLKSLTLCDEPGFEQRNAIGLETLEELALELSIQLFEEIEVASGNRRFDTLCNPKRVHIDGRRIDGHPIVFGLHALVGRLVEEGADLGKTPAQLAARIVGHVPEQLAKPGAMDGTRRHEEIDDERPDLARGRERCLSPVSRYSEGAEQPHRNRLARRLADAVQIQRQPPRWQVHKTKYFKNCSKAVT